MAEWREDVLQWLGRRGYLETGGGVWGQLDGEDAAELTRPTRYFILTVSSGGAGGAKVRPASRVASNGEWLEPRIPNSTHGVSRKRSRSPFSGASVFDGAMQESGFFSSVNT